jgi:hypothetical protein
MIRLKTFNADDRKLWVVINQRKESMAGIFQDSYWIPTGFLQDSYWIPTGFLLFTRYIAPRH